LRLPPKRQRIRREYQELLAPEKVNEGWAMDFVSDWVIGPEKQAIRVINIMDECSRRALWTEAHTSISAAKLIKVLNLVVEWRGAPTYIRCDNGPEFIA
jgi:putative transposase